jgi:hypothetical protein
MSTLAVFLVLAGGTAIAASVKTDDIKNEAVTTKKIAKKAIKPPRIATEAVKTNKLRDEAVSTDKLRDDAVTTPKVDDLAITTPKIANAAVTDEKLANPVLWARVLADGTLDRNEGATVGQRINAGNYRVEFTRDVSACIFQVTPENVSQSLTAHADIDATNAQRVFVSLRNGADAVRTDGNFQVAAFC